MELFHLGFLTFSLIDLVDILAVTVVFYQVYRIMSGTRATQLFAGLLVLLVSGSVAQLLGMTGLSWLIRSVGAVWVIAFVILFQPELRRILIRVGQLGVLHTLLRAGEERVLSEVVQAAMELSRRRFGALMIFQRTTGLRGVVETGVPLQAEVTWQLLVTIFHPRTPLHDGAVVISGNTILAASCLIPLSTVHPLEGGLGTRHRAALDATAEVDSVALVISEETGAISVCESGRFTGRDLDEPTLREELTRLLYPKSHLERAREPWGRGFGRRRAAARPSKRVDRPALP